MSARPDGVVGPGRLSHGPMARGPLGAPHLGMPPRRQPMSALSAADRLLNGETGRLRLVSSAGPTTHFRDMAGGFCFLNNVGKSPRKHLLARFGPRRDSGFSMSHHGQRHPGHFLRARRRLLRLNPCRPPSITTRGLPAMRTSEAQAPVWVTTSTCPCSPGPADDGLRRRCREASGSNWPLRPQTCFWSPPVLTHRRTIR